MEGLIENIKIAGIASCVPRHTEDNMDYGSVLGEKRVKRQVKLTGIRKRHTSRIEQRASDLAVCAANDLLTKLVWKKDEIGVLIYMTQSPDYLIPSTAIALQERMGLPKEVVAFDVNLGCSSFGYGIHIASSLMNTMPACKKALCLVADRVENMESKRLLNADTVSFSLLTGSAASAVAIEKKQGACITFSESCDGSHYDAILARSSWTGTYMQGNMVFEYAINDVSNRVNQFMEDHKLQVEDIDYFIFHQAQKLILDNISFACNIPSEKMLTSLEEYGNTSGASVPLTLCANAELLHKKDCIKVITCGFGVGLSCSIDYMELSTDTILPVIESDWHYDEDKERCGVLWQSKIIVMDADTSLMEYVSEILDMQTAELILCGKNRQKLEEIANKHFWNTKIVVGEDEMEIVNQLSEEENVTAIVGQISEDSVDKLLQNHILQEDASIIILDEKECDLPAIHEEYPSVRICSLVYNEKSLDIINDNWTYEFIKNNLPIQMIRPTYLAFGIGWCLRKESKLFTKMTLYLDDSLDKFTL